MAQTVKIKRSAVAGKVPTTSDLELGELAVNTYDGKIYTKKDDGTASVIEIGGGVSSFSGGTTGLTPSTATTGAVTLSGTLAVANGGTGVTSSTGSGSNVLSTSPTLVTPVLGTPTSGTLTNCTGYTFANLAGTPTTLAGYGITDGAKTDGTGATGTWSIAISGNATTATNLSSNRTFALTGDVTGSVSSNLSSGASIATSIAAGAVVDADVNAAAAIAGTKISPNFGSQNVVTTSSVTAASLIPSGATVPSNGLYLPAANSVALSTGTSERLRIDSSGRLLVGTSSARGNFYNTTGQEVRLQIEGTNYRDAAESITLNSNDNLGAQLILAKSRGTTIGSNTIAQNGDESGRINFMTNDGSEFVETAAIRAFVDGTPGANDMPGRLVFSTTADGASSPTERLRIDSSGNVGIGTSSPDLRLTVQEASTGSCINLLSSDGNPGGRIGTSGGATTSNALILNANRGSGSIQLQVASIERARIDSSGRLLVGTSTSIPGAFSDQGLLQVNAGGAAGYAGYRFSNDVGGAIIYLYKSRSATTGVNTIVQSGDICGNINFAGGDGSTYHRAASITGEVDGTPATNAMPGRLVFSTTASGASSPTERMRIDSTGFISLGGDTNTGLSNPSADNLAITTGGSERARIDSSGRLLVGTSTSRSNYSAYGASLAQIEGANNDGARALSVTYGKADTGDPIIALGKHRSNSVGGTTIVAAGDGLGQVVFSGSDGTNFVTAAFIRAQVDGTPGANDMPGRLVFSTTADGSATPTERLRIDSTGVLQIADAGNITVGTTTGTKIGTATTQKLGFYNATPVVQPAAVADATDAASVITQLNALLSRLRTLGIIAT